MADTRAASAADPHIRSVETAFLREVPRLGITPQQIPAVRHEVKISHALRQPGMAE